MDCLDDLLAAAPPPSGGGSGSLLDGMGLTGAASASASPGHGHGGVPSSSNGAHVGGGSPPAGSAAPRRGPPFLTLNVEKTKLLAVPVLASSGRVPGGIREGNC